MTDEPQAPEPDDRPLRMLAMLCGYLLGTLRGAGIIGSGDQERLLADMEAATGAEGTPQMTALLDEVRWMAERVNRRPGSPETNPGRPPTSQ